MTETIARQGSGIISADELPPECRSVNRRKLTQLEALERDAIVARLQDNGGNKQEAARALGMSRATIYRKINDYGSHNTHPLVGPKALTNNHHREARPSLGICSHKLRIAKAGDVPLAPQPSAATRRAADRFPIRTARPARQIAAGSRLTTRMPLGIAHLQTAFAALLVIFEILGESPG